MHEGRSIEEKAREDFAKIIKILAHDNPYIKLVFRPHSVLDPCNQHQK